MLFEHTCSIQRNQALGTNGRHVLTSVASSVRCLFLPMSGQAEIRAGLPIGHGWQVFFPMKVDVRTGDKLIYDGASFTAGTPKPFKTKFNPHIELMAQRETD